MANAICPFCSKNITVQDGSLQEYKCSSCGNTLTVALLREKDAFVDIEASNSEFKEGKQYFDEKNFVAAAECFKRSLKYNANNFLAEYYSGLNEINQNAESDEFNVPKALSKMFVGSVVKVNNADLEQGNKVNFVSTLAKEVYLSLLSQYNEYNQRFDNFECQNIFRKKCKSIVRAVHDIISLDGAFLCLFDKTVIASYKDIAELAIEVCFRIAHSFAEGFDSVNTIPESDFEKVNERYMEFTAFIKSLDKKYKCPHKINFEDNITCNKDALGLIEKYYDFNRGNKKARLSITGDFLENMTRQCMTAVRLTYFTCVRNIGVVKNDPVRNELINQAIVMGLEIITPRMYVDGKHRVSAIVKDLKQLRFVTEFMDLLADSLSDSAKKTAGDTFKKFFANVYDTVKMHYEKVNTDYQKIINKLKHAQNEEFSYYLGFLYDMSLACSTALCRTFGYVKYKTKSRISLLKQCRKICEEFFLLTDYRVESIEKSRYKDIISIYGALDGDISYLAKA